ncbi:hypothetical protein EI77_04589 [Prosthecobacter fusiformis]|uniref:Uncharacterized protein n=1 Tax=Prosthecobacter fusiformis TaxID=48464 RepID=A0A4R7RIE1_9BACT|nr:hypothetical protein EI77_04589 [Prosthecobacter fusiformis]
MKDLLNPLPSIQHTHVCTYIECNAQVETAARAYRFGLLEGSPQKMVVFFQTVRHQPGSFATWTQMDIEDAIAERIRSEVNTIHIPLCSPARNWSSMHCNRSLMLEARGMALDLWWDSEDSPLGDALRPLLCLLRDVVKATELISEKKRRAIILDDEL